MAWNAMRTLMPTRASNETYVGVTYHIDGGLVPALSARQPQGRAASIGLTWRLGGAVKRSV